ncbi:TonB-dependent receptor [Mucilaginibacter lutimaris]|uniref:TonB-dependent receptor n=1 Tax=Mucilaginibacter lutimaris TaxID=931629 RepID=A0ABW2ZBB3_9SPHI
MKRKNLLLICLTLPFVALFTAFTDDDWLNALITNINKWRDAHPQEKVHLHLDKPYYSIGDDIWFKAYVVNSEKNELSTLSNILYVDLVDDRDSIHETKVVPLNNGLGNGEFALSDSLVTAGKYHLKAYTRWMQNYNDEFIFNKDIEIGDARVSTDVFATARFAFEPDSKVKTTITYANVKDKSLLVAKQVNYSLISKDRELSSGKLITDAEGKIILDKTIRKEFLDDAYLETEIFINKTTSVKRRFAVINSAGKVDVQFFPEGGRLVNGLRSKVAFKATLPGGYGANVTGYVVDQANQTVAEFESAHAGMGVFPLQPVAGNKYTAVVKDASGKESRYAMPAADEEGYVLAVNNNRADSLGIIISTSKLLVGKAAALIMQQNNVVKYAVKAKIDQPYVKMNVAKSLFSTGILQVTLLSAEANPLAERLLFVERNDQLKLNVINNKTTYGKREKVQMQLVLKDADGSPMQGNLSVAITDAGKVKTSEDEQTTIFSNLLLTSDLKGFVEKPNYYFNPANEDRAKHLDYLLLTQGWRRFKWVDAKAGKVDGIAYQPEKSIGVSGMVTTIGNKPIPNGKLTLYGNTPQGPLLVDTVTDDKGNFVVDGLNFTNNVKFVVRAKNAKGKDRVRIVLNKVPVPKYNSFNVVDDAAANNFIDYLMNTQKRFDQFAAGMPGKTTMLKEVTIRERKNGDNSIKGSAALGLSGADRVIKKDKLVAYSSLLQAFYGVAGVEVRNDVVYRIGRVSSITRPRGEPMTVMVNGMTIDPSTLKDISPFDVEGIELFTSGASTVIYGDAGVWGVIQITLKKGGEMYHVPIFYLDKILVRGYSPQREFYSPAYDQPNEKHAEADFRSTIYWQPNVVTDSDGKASISYFTADEPGTYHVVAEGLNLEGKLVRQVVDFKVGK